MEGMFSAWQVRHRGAKVGSGQEWTRHDGARVGRLGDFSQASQVTVLSGRQVTVSYRQVSLGH